MFVEKELHDERYPWFYAAVKSTGLEQLTTCVTRMCQLFLGLEEEGISWCVKAEGADGICDGEAHTRTAAGYQGK